MAQDMSPRISDDDRDTAIERLSSRDSLANAYAAGDLGRAILMFEATLAQREQVLGDDHPSTLASRRNLARARRIARTRQQPNTATAPTTP